MFGLVANVMTDHALRTGAKVHVISYAGDMGRVEVSGLDKRGRRITKYMAWKRLTNIRACYFHPAPWLEWCSLWWDDKESAEKVALELTEMWQFVRSFHPDGRLLNDGISQGQALKEYREKKGLESFHEVAPILSVGERLKALRAAGTYYVRDLKKKHQANSSVG